MTLNFKYSVFKKYQLVCYLKTRHHLPTIESVVVSAVSFDQRAEGSTLQAAVDDVFLLGVALPVLQNSPYY